MPALIRPITAVTVSIIANVPLRLYGRSVICLPRKDGRHLAAGQLYVWVAASDVGMIGDNQAGITVAHVSASTLSEVRNPGDLLSCDAPYHRIIIRPGSIEGRPVFE